MIHDDERRPGGDGDRTGPDLRSLIDGADFDHDALVAGTLSRARGIRRRRAVTRGLVAAVLVPTLVGAGWTVRDMVLDEPPVAHVASRDDAGATATGAPTTAEQEQDLAEATAEPQPAPYQETTPPQPSETSPGSLSNRHDVPDARPSGVDFLDAFGAPQTESEYPKTSPLMMFLVSAGEGALPHSARDWAYHDGSNAVDQETVDLVITAWDDADGAMEALRAGGRPSDLGFVWQDAPTREGTTIQISDWPDATGDPDRLLATSQDSMTFAGALVRQGSYLVGVSVRAGDGTEAVEAATEIADRTAANLAAMDPERATDGGGGAGR